MKYQRLRLMLIRRTSSSFFMISITNRHRSMLVDEKWWHYRVYQHILKVQIIYLTDGRFHTLYHRLYFSIYNTSVFLCVLACVVLKLQHTHMLELYLVMIDIECTIGVNVSSRSMTFPNRVIIVCWWYSLAAFLNYCSHILC